MARKRPAGAGIDTVCDWHSEDGEEWVVTRATHLRDINVEVDGDEDTPSIYGAVRLADDTLILIDNINDNVKRLDKSYTVVDHIQLPDTPHGICRISDEEVAITLSSVNTVQFVSVNPRLSTTRSFKTDRKCYSIVHHDGELYMILGGAMEPQELRVYNIDGQPHPLRSYDNQSIGRNVLSSACQIHVSSDGSVIYIADLVTGIIALSNNGRLLWVFDDTCVEGTTGICEDSHGNLIVCGKESNSVVQLSADGKRRRVLLTEADGLNQPVFVTMLDNPSIVLLVSMYYESIVKLFELNYSLQPNSTNVK